MAGGNGSEPPPGTTAMAGFRNVMDDGIHLIELGVTVEGDCPDLDP